MKQTSENEKCIDFFIFCTSFTFCLHFCQPCCSSCSARQDTCWTAGSAPLCKNNLVRSFNCSSQNSTFDDVYKNISEILGCLDHLGNMHASQYSQQSHHLKALSIWVCLQIGYFQISCLTLYHHVRHNLMVTKLLAVYPIISIMYP